jgi:hypothetical protein
MNPWLALPLGDYEGHMRSPDVDQLGPLSDLFSDILRRHRPASVAILGIAGGNGLADVDPSVTGRVVGLDLNPQYLDVTRQRFPDLPGLELQCVDLATSTLAVPPVALVHAAMVFEHAGTGRCLDNALALVAPGGVFSTVLQLPSETAGAVGVTAFPAMETLAGQFAFVDPGLLQQVLTRRGWHLIYQSHLPLPSGKAFWSGVFARHELADSDAPIG